MSQFTIPRLAIGTVDPTPSLWLFLRVFLQGLAGRGINVQTFLAHASFFGFQDLKRWSGATPRHLDSWLMSPAACRTSFVRGVVGADLAIVVGTHETGVISAGKITHSGQTCTGVTTYITGGSPSRKTSDVVIPAGSPRPCVCSGEDKHSIPFLGRLNRLCDWLGLSKLLLLSTSQIDRGCLPGALTEEKWEGIFLIDADPAVPPLQYTLDFEVYYGIPLLGIMYLKPPQKAELATEFSIWTEGGVQLWLNRVSLQRILRESAQRPLFVDEWPTTDYRGRITVALATDSVFECYFPETIEALERCGARIVDFSPLRDEQIPAGTDVIYLGCGQPGIYAAELFGNHCLKASIRNHVRKGGRIYAEGAGAAYLCQWMEIEPGQFIRGVGLFAAAARRLPRFGEPMPVTLTTTRRTWLAGSGTVLRGYRNPEWWFQPESLSAPLIAESGFEYDILANERVFASVIHLDFSTQTELLDSFFDSKAAVREFSKDVLSITHQKT